MKTFFSWTWIVLATALCVACSGGESNDGARQTATLKNATPAAETAAPAHAPLRKTFAQGETVDIANGVLFLDPKTGGGEAWADVRSSPSGMFVAWNGADGKQPPVLFETDTYRKIPLDTGGAFGTVLGFASDDSEASVRVGDELLVVSTETGKVRLRFALAPGAIFPSATWGPGGRVAVQSSKPDRTTLGLVAWVDGSMKSFPTVPDSWAQWSPDGTALLAAGIEADGWLALIDIQSATFKRIEGAHPNPRWSESGLYFAAQVSSGEVIVYRADGTPHMRLGGVCAEIGNPWVGDEIATWGYGNDVMIAMDGTLSPYVPASHNQPMVDVRPDGSVALVDSFRGANVLAELKPPQGVALTGTLGEPWITSDGRGRLVIGGGAKGGCENVGAFKVELLP